MAQPYVGQILLFAGTFAPSGYAMCDGSLLSISSYDTLFNLIGTTYGGDGVSTFALPDLRGRVSVGMGQGPGQPSYTLGESGGVEQVTLTGPQLPSHNHAAMTVGAANPTNTPNSTTMFGDQTGGQGATPLHVYGPNTPAAQSALAANTIGSAPLGGPSPHENRQPLLAITVCIALYGVYPPQN